MKGEGKMKNSPFKFTTKAAVAMGIGAALYGALGYIGIPIGPNTTLKPAIAILTIFGAMFGPMVGFVVGFVGHVITDMLAGWGVWWGWVLSSAIMGLFMGLVYSYKDFDVNEGTAEKKHIIYMIVTGIIGIIVAIVFAGGFDILVMGEPFDKMVVQVGGAIIANIVVFIVIGVPAVLGIAKRNKKNSNLTMDK